MDRRAFLTRAGALLAVWFVPGCAGPRRRRVRRARRRARRRRRRFRRIVRRSIRRGGVVVSVFVISAHCGPGDVVHLEEMGECEVVVVEKERCQVKKPGGVTVWVDVVVEGDDKGEEEDAPGGEE